VKSVVATTLRIAATVTNCGEGGDPADPHVQAS
jgi:hypothetical protein